jgi:DNA invertase Pin-like site-specific DNA recombinase
MQTVNPPVRKCRCAIYTRKSSEEGLEMEFNSLDAQREACASFIASQRHEGWVQLESTYDDGGYSGGTIERPALKRLLSDIALGLIDTVVVYKVDRLSRSLADFAKLVETFDAKNVTFVSVTQQFNTTTSMGRLTLNILLSFAQFEREVIGERIRDKFAASKRKGMWMGGVTPFGYEVRDRQLHVQPEQARAIRLIFDSFLMLKSVARVAHELPALGVVSRARVARSGRSFGGTPLDRGAVYKILSNPVYIGKIRHKDQVHDGRHEPIIAQDVWDRVHALLGDSPRGKSPSSKRKSKAPLTGVLKCGGCMSSMTPVHTRKQGGRLYRYYAPTSYLKGGCGDCQIRRIAAREVEALVVSQLQTVFAAPEMIMAVWKEAARQDQEIDSDAIRDAFSDLMPVWNELFPKEQERLIALMLEKVVVYPDAVDIRVRAAGLESIVRELDRQKKRLEDGSGYATHIAAE